VSNRRRRRSSSSLSQNPSAPRRTARKLEKMEKQQAACEQTYRKTRLRQKTNRFATTGKRRPGEQTHFHTVKHDCDRKRTVSHESVGSGGNAFQYRTVKSVGSGPGGQTHFHLQCPQPHNSVPGRLAKGHAQTPFEF